MKLAAATVALALALGATALSDKVKAALITFGARSHPSPHTEQVLVVELSEYSTNAGLTDAARQIGQKKYALAAAALEDHVRSIKSDPLVQHGAQLAEPFMMLNDCVTELRALL